MAGPPCMSDDGRPAVFVGTMLQTGDAVALCDECLVPWTAALLNVMTGIDPTPFLAAVATESEDAPSQPADAQADSSAADGSGDDHPPDGEANGKPARAARSRTANTAPADDGQATSDVTP